MWIHFILKKIFLQYKCYWAESGIWLPAATHRQNPAAEVGWKRKEIFYSKLQFGRRARFCLRVHHSKTPRGKPHQTSPRLQPEFLLSFNSTVLWELQTAEHDHRGGSVSFLASSGPQAPSWSLSIGLVWPWCLCPLPCWGSGGSAKHCGQQCWGSVMLAMGPATHHSHVASRTCQSVEAVAHSSSPVGPRWRSPHFPLPLDLNLLAQTSSQS